MYFVLVVMLSYGNTIIEIPHCLKRQKHLDWIFRMPDGPHIIIIKYVSYLLIYMQKKLNLHWLLAQTNRSK